MPLSITLAEAKGFLRVAEASEDALVTLLIDAAEARVAAAVGAALTPASPAPLRLAVLTLVSYAYERRAQFHEGTETPLGLVESWLAPYRTTRL